MKAYALTILAIMASARAMAQEESYKGNPHIIIPVDKPHVSVPYDQQHITIPIPDSQVTNLFSPGYHTSGDKLMGIKLASRKTPGRVFFLKIGDFMGNYRIDRLVGTGMDYALYLVKSNETVIISAHQASDTHKNKAEQAGPAYPPQGVGSADP